jgi:hypothetical protein
MTKAQLRYLEKVIRTASCSCDSVGEWRTRQSCVRNGWLRHEPNPRGNMYPNLTYITDKARALISAAA